MDSSLPVHNARAAFLATQRSVADQPGSWIRLSIAKAFVLAIIVNTSVA
jgi:hypothetical protein